ncbi:MAG: single-stranded DNA-binding protein [Desulfovibrio sp.]|nr:single-stranded DNA-binding protein [Desulfovibrio sp.]
MLNKVTIIGRLGRDPELRYTQSGSPVTSLSVATDESYTDRDGNKVDRTEWHRISVFQRQAENCANYLGKGSLVYVEGSLTTRKWQDQNGQDRYTTEIKAQRVLFLDRKGDGVHRGPDEYYESPARSGSGGQSAHAGGIQQIQDNGPPHENLGPAFPSEAASMDEVPF